MPFTASRQSRKSMAGHLDPRKSIAAQIAFIFVFAAFFLFLCGIFFPKDADEIGFEIDNPGYLFGCYFYGNSEIVLQRDSALFNGRRVPIKYSSDKTLREIIYPETYPWINLSDGNFVLKNDRFALIDLIEDDDNVWTIQIETSDYLRSNDPEDLAIVYFERGDCEQDKAAELDAAYFSRASRIMSRTLWPLLRSCSGERSSSSSAVMVRTCCSA